MIYSEKKQKFVPEQEKMSTKIRMHLNVALFITVRIKIITRNISISTQPLLHWDCIFLYVHIVNGSAAGCDMPYCSLHFMVVVVAFFCFVCVFWLLKFFTFIYCLMKPSKKLSKSLAQPLYVLCVMSTNESLSTV